MGRLLLAVESTAKERKNMENGTLIELLKAHPTASVCAKYFTSADDEWMWDGEEDNTIHPANDDEDYF